MAEKILFVDDDLDILALVEMNLISDGFEVICAVDGPEALVKAKEENPDLILLDIGLPGMDGYEVLDKLKEDPNLVNTPVIMLTAYAQQDQKIRGLRAGVEDYITKPFEAEELLLRIRNVLSRAKKAEYVNPLMGAMGDWFTEEGIEQLGIHLKTASEIQRRLLPKDVPHPKGIEIARMLKSSMSVSGDFYDFIPLGNEQVGVAIADIKGKGIPAALLMVMVRTILRIVCREEISPAGVLKRINDILAEDTAPDLFATMVYGILDPNERTFTYSNAGHCFPIRVSPNKKRPDLLKTGGMLLGIFNFAEFEPDTVILEKDDLMFFYTDGITETEKEDEENEFFGEDRLVEFLQENISLPVKQICEEVERTLVDFSGTSQRSDDLTMLVIKVTE